MVERQPVRRELWDRVLLVGETIDGATKGRRKKNVTKQTNKQTNKHKFSGGGLPIDPALPVVRILHVANAGFTEGLHLRLNAQLIADH